MKRILLGSLFFAAFGLALAGPPVDYQLYCEVTDDVTMEMTFAFIGVASEVEGQLHVALIDGALEACVVVDGAVTVAAYPQGVDPATPDAEGSFALTFEVDGTTGDWVFVPGVEPEFETTIEEVPQVAVEGMRGAQENRAEAFQRAEGARARAEEHAGGPPMDVPGRGDDDEAEDDAEIEVEEGGPPVALPEPAAPGRP